jgi:hypothetical protein
MPILLLFTVFIINVVSPALAEDPGGKPTQRYMVHDYPPPCDLNVDYKCDSQDVDLYLKTLGACLDKAGRAVLPDYIPLADIDRDGCVTSKDIPEYTDSIIERRYKSFTEISLTGNCDIYSKEGCSDEEITRIIQLTLGSCETIPGYLPELDQDKDQCITERDTALLFPEFYKRE